MVARGFWVLGFGFRVLGLGFRVLGFGYTESEGPFVGEAPLGRSNGHGGRGS